MSLKIGQNRRVPHGAGLDDDLADARTLVGEMVAKAEARAASRTLAYTSVGRSIGRSACWVYRLTSGTGEVGLSRKTWRAIVTAYTAHSEALARAAEASRRRAELLHKQADDAETFRAPRPGSTP